ncbi:MaoC/PaaZ C-terminal domain-containing protein [Flavisphingomonas formosensis]|uniref:MaoC/PaaZ C-terminal domain-containing protein n=1 Tax=Flavisphingomonas formosensis TaxID=861534 RepID=UPI0012FCD4C2|nr:MaoC/PaaZ C-terminal domain-containing protein [Sphingomonas formosensis]
MGLAVEDFEVGRTFETRGRTVGEGDISLYAGLVGDWTPIHMDDHFAQAQGWPARIAHGTLPMNMAIGMFSQMGVLDDGVIGALGVEWSFRGPVVLGDTIYATVTVLETRVTSNPARGVVKFGFAVRTQAGAAVQDGTLTVMMKTRNG